MNVYSLLQLEENKMEAQLKLKKKTVVIVLEISEVGFIEMNMCL